MHRWIQEVLGRDTHRRAAMRIDKRLQAWLATFPLQNGIHQLSPARYYEQEESLYDEQYGNESLDEGRAGVLTGQLEQYCSLSHPRAILELACGPGTLTLGLRSCFPKAHLLAADASPAFLRILAGKLQRLAWPSSAWPKLLQLSDEDLACLPPKCFDLICVRSGLHHFVDWPLRLQQLAAALADGGVLALYEPRAEFFLTTSLLLDLAMVRASETLREELHAFVELFSRTTDFYIRQDSDKSAAEDKHAFFIEDLLLIAARVGLTLMPIGAEHDCPFSSAFNDYLLYCMSASPAVMTALSDLLEPELHRLNGLYGARRSPYGAAEWYLLRKRSLLPVRS